MLKKLSVNNALRFRSFILGLFGLLMSCSSLQPLNAQVIVAHRGASADAPENTLAAFRLAFEQEADGIEGDFYLTADQHIVCIHDKDTLRTGKKKLIVAESTLAQLRELEYGSWFNDKFAGEPIPTFREVLDTVPDGRMFVIELKTGPEIVPYLKKELETYRRNGQRLLIIAFNQDTVAACKDQITDVKVHWLTSFEEKNGQWSPHIDEVIGTMKKIGADGIGMKGVPALHNQEYLRQLAMNGIREFHVWTVDAVEVAKHFQSLGAFGITTNKPAFIRSSLE